MKKLKRLPFSSLMMIVLAAFMLFNFTGCSSSGGGGSEIDDTAGTDVSEPVSETVLTGVFVDSPVAGLNYETDTQAGVTNSKGEFKYIAGETIKFSIGGLLLGSDEAKDFMTPIDLVEDAVDETHPVVTNMGRFMQSLDDDGDLENGITISSKVAERIAGKKINFIQSVVDFENDPEVTGFFDQLNEDGIFQHGHQALNSAEEAWKHMKEHMFPGSTDDDSEAAASEDTDDDAVTDDSADTEPEDNTGDDSATDDTADTDAETDVDDEVKDDTADDSVTDDTADTEAETDADDEVKDDNAATDDDTTDVEPGSTTDDDEGDTEAVEDTDENKDEVKTGIFVDSPVAGLYYETATQSGITNVDGEFTYIDGETIEFSISDIILGMGTAKEVMTPIDLVEGAVDETDSTVTNICRFIQSLDEDGDLSNGIAVSEQIRDAVIGKNINFAQETADFEIDPEVTGLFEHFNENGMFQHGQQMLHSAENALAHMRESMEALLNQDEEDSDDVMDDADTDEADEDDDSDADSDTDVNDDDSDAADTDEDDESADSDTDTNEDNDDESDANGDTDEDANEDSDTDTTDETEASV